MGYRTQSYQLLICFHLLLLYSHHCSAKLCSHEQSSALLKFKQLFSFEKDSSSVCEKYQQVSRPKMMSWKEDVDCCSSWDGVTCDMVTGHVIGLDLSCSWLHGSIPSNSSLFFLPHLQKLNLALNDFNYSKISSGFSQLRTLTLLNLSSSNFRGSVPESLGNISQLKYLNLSHNSFSGHIPSSFSNLQQLHHLDLWDNKFVGKIPDIFTNLTQLSYLDLGWNQLTGQIPSSVRMLSNLAIIFLDFNSFNGKIPSELSLMKSLQALDLRMNNFQGIIPLTYEVGCHLSFLQLYGNHLEGPLPPSLVNCVNLEFVDVGNNNLSGPIPEYLGNSKLKVLDMRMNKFNGSLPQTFAARCSLTILSLNGNLLEGPLSPSLVNCQHLKVLDVGNNLTDDTFPHWLDVLTELQVLILRSNRFRGPIGDTKTRVPFPKLRIIDLSHNQLAGILPIRYLDNFKAMMHGEENNSAEVDYMTWPIYTYFESINLTMKGVDIHMERILTILMTIDLSSNKFQGGISEVLGKLNSLKALNISHNNLTGGIPTSLENLTELESLDLSSNMLVGQIPMQLTRLKSLSVLNLSYNHLDGPIPEGPQFNTFPNDSYAGNLELCGFPLSKICRIDEAPEPAPPKSFHEEEEDDSSSWFDWKFAKMGYGSGVAIGLSIRYMVFATGKPRWLSRLIEKKQSNTVARRVVGQGRARRN